MIRLEIGLEIRHRGVMSLCTIEDKTAVVVVASYRSVSTNPVRLKALPKTQLFIILVSFHNRHSFLMLEFHNTLKPHH